ncbi:cytochrome P450 [Colletotrichum kahawae]|uniref:Cytochrome P450 n=1 Tax=Colletotrichum kahawae TaxID=34407 RepID=A0AAD9YU60_COLKA|nr:cytochrome P450 [Colletotrichum kahawae]
MPPGATRNNNNNDNKSIPQAGEMRCLPIFLSSHPKPRETPEPIFIYGPLCFKPALANILRRDSGGGLKDGQLRSARVPGYTCRVMYGFEGFAAIAKENQTMDGFIFQPATPSQRCRIDNEFRREEFQMIKVTPMLRKENPNNASKNVDEIDMYFWQGSLLFDRPWKIDSLIGMTWDCTRPWTGHPAFFLMVQQMNQERDGTETEEGRHLLDLAFPSERPLIFHFYN